MKIGLLTDNHFGVRSQSPLFLKQAADFHRNQFFPYLKKNKITTVLHGGDLVDNRKYITYNTAQVMRESYIEPSLALGLKTHLIVGNHDAFHKSSIEINAMREMLPPEAFESYILPEELEFGGQKFLLLPWICKANYSDCMEAIENSSADILLGHLELLGFDQYKGMPSTHGMDHTKFDSFREVWSGHYHQPSEQDNIKYIGAPYQMTWGDYDSPRGFSVYDTKTKTLEFIQNTVEIFQRIEYDDSGKTTKQIMADDFSKYEGKIVKVIVNRRENKKAYDQYLDHIEKSGVSDIQIVDTTIHTMDKLIDVDESKQSTLEIIVDSVKEFDDTNDKAALETLLKELYNEAVNMET
jgi:DNA repair exonuclease SbcCD nuclease subunit